MINKQLNRQKYNYFLLQRILAFSRRIFRRDWRKNWNEMEIMMLWPLSKENSIRSPVHRDFTQISCFGNRTFRCKRLVGSSHLKRDSHREESVGGIVNKRIWLKTTKTSLCCGSSAEQSRNVSSASACFRGCFEGSALPRSLGVESPFWQSLRVATCERAVRGCVGSLWKSSDEGRCRWGEKYFKEEEQNYWKKYR